MNECLEHRSLVGLSFYRVCVHLTSCWNNAYVRLILQGYSLSSVCSYFLSHCTFVIGKEKRRRLFSFLLLNSLYWYCGGRIFKVCVLSVGLIYLCIPNPLVSWIIGMDCFFAPPLFFCQGERFKLVRVSMEKGDLLISVCDGNRWGSPVLFMSSVCRAWQVLGAKKGTRFRGKCSKGLVSFSGELFNYRQRVSDIYTVF